MGSQTSQWEKVPKLLKVLFYNFVFPTPPPLEEPFCYRRRDFRARVEPKTSRSVPTQLPEAFSLTLVFPRVWEWRLCVTSTRDVRDLVFRFLFVSVGGRDTQMKGGVRGHRLSWDPGTPVTGGCRFVCARRTRTGVVSPKGVRRSRCHGVFTLTVFTRRVEGSDLPSIKIFR